MNIGLSNILKANFPDTTLVPKPHVYRTNSFDPFWISEFVISEDNFRIFIKKDTTKIGFSLRLKFQITQYSWNVVLIKNFIKYFSYGRIK